MAPKKATRWYLFCKDAHSNEIISRILDELYSIDEFKEYTCNDDKNRHLYHIPEYSFAARIFRSNKQFATKLEIYCGKDGKKPTEWKFAIPKKISVAVITAKSNIIKKSALAIHQQ